MLHTTGSNPLPTLPPDLADLPRILTRRQVADLAQITPTTVTAWAAAGRLPRPLPCSSSRCLRFDRDAVLAHLGILGGPTDA
jgi:hypothetical protein